jgi:hypothetical protein
MKLRPLGTSDMRTVGNAFTVAINGNNVVAAAVEDPGEFGEKRRGRHPAVIVARTWWCGEKKPVGKLRHLGPTVRLPRRRGPPLVPARLQRAGLARPRRIMTPTGLRYSPLSLPQPASLSTLRLLRSNWCAWSRCAVE